MLLVVVISFSAVVFLMTFAWFWSCKRNEADVVDFCWASSIAILSLCYCITGTAQLNLRTTLAIINVIWGFRLSWYLLFTRVLKQGEDGRYQRLRVYWGARANRNFFWFFQAQAVLVIFIASQFLLAANSSFKPHNLQLLIGSLIGIGAILGEALADRQLFRFVSNSDNRGYTCQVGLWKYSRHPNYFFEWLHWCSYPIILLPSSAGVYSVVISLVMLVLIIKFSGIPPTEARAAISRKDYLAYKSKTSLFIPWFPKG